MTNREYLDNLTDEDYAKWLSHQLWPELTQGELELTIRYNAILNFLKGEYK